MLPDVVVEVEAEKPKDENQPPHEPPTGARRARRGLTVVEIVLPVEYDVVCGVVVCAVCVREGHQLRRFLNVLLMMLGLVVFGPCVVAPVSGCVQEGCSG